MQQLTDSLRSLTTTVLATLGALIVVSLSVIPLVNLVPAGFLQVFALPGRFLFASFHAAAAFIPLYLIAAAAMVRRGGSASLILALNLSILPFLTLAVAMRLGFDARVGASPVTAGVEHMLGASRGATAFGLLTILLAALVLAIWYMWARFDVERRLPGNGREDSEPDVSGDVLELPAPAAAFAWRYTPRGKARAAEAAAGGAATNEAFRSEEDEDIPPVVRSQQTAATDGPDEREGLQIAWPGGRSRVQFDDDDSVAGYYPAQQDSEPLEQQAAHPDRVVSSAQAHDRLIVEFRDGRFRSVDGEGDEVLLGFPSSESADDSPGEETIDDMAALEELEAIDEDEPEFGERAHDDSPFDLDDEDAVEDYDREDYDSDGEYYDENAGDDESLEDAATLSAGSDTDDSPDESTGAAGDGLEEPVADAKPRAAGKTSGRRKKNRYDVPIEGLLHEYPNERYWELDERTRSDGETLRYTLQEFGIEAEVTGIRKGPVITMYEILPAPGVKLTKIVNLADNIALRLAAQTVRIVAPIPGKHAVGIEVPNKRRAIVSFADLVQQPGFTDKEQSIPMAIGKDIPGDAQIIDLAKTPHLLIAGATGSGKSVCVNSIICSVLYRRPPEDVKMILIDPKIVELKFYNDIPHLLTPVITEPKRAFQALQWALYEMERRYSLLDSLQVRDIRSYNQKVKARKLATETLPYLVIVVDEFADLMATSGKELESTLARLAAMSRAVGIHLVLATQRPSTDVITGLIKANIPSRIAFMVASKVDSRIILDSQGAEKLLGRGDMLFTSAWDPAPIRMQGAFLSEDEVERVVNHVKTLGEPEYIDDEIFIDDDEDPDLQEDLEDPLMEKAISVVQQSRKASASYLQRRLKIGYNRAARMVEEMERLGIVGPANGSKPREILRNEAVGVGE